MPVRFSYREVLDIRRIPASTEDNQAPYVGLHPLLDVLWPDGTDANEADDFWVNYAQPIAGSGTATLDLKSLSGGPDGGSVDFAEVRAILIRARSTNGDAIRVSPHSSNGWDGLGSSFEIEIPPGGFFRVFCGVDGALPVASNTKSIDLDNLHSGAAVVDVLIVGTSA
jgi:hypothetical protein